MAIFFKLFFSKDKPRMVASIGDLKPYYLETLNSIENILREGKIYPQASYVEKTIVSLKKENYEKFIKKLKSVNFWGGSGSVWEVYFEDNQLQKRFNLEMVKLIDLMEKAKIQNNAIKPLKKIFELEI